MHRAVRNFFQPQGASEEHSRSYVTSERRRCWEKFLTERCVPICEMSSSLRSAMHLTRAPLFSVSLAFAMGCVLGLDG